MEMALPKIQREPFSLKTRAGCAGLQGKAAARTGHADGGALMLETLSFQRQPSKVERELLVYLVI